MPANQKRNQWIEAAKLLCEDPLKKIPCPNCNTGILSVKDVYVSGYDKTDRWLICDSCGSVEVMTFNGK